MKLLLAILLFASIADANAQNTVIKDKDGSAWVLQQRTIRVDGAIVSGMYYVTAANGYAAAAASGCQQGQGRLHVRSADTGKAFDWNYRDDNVVDRLAIALCAEGLSK